MCVALVCKPDCHVMNFEVDLIFLIKLFFLYDQNVKEEEWQELKYFANKKSF